MQRLHQFDLPGMLLDAGTRDHLSLPAIAEVDEVIPLTRGRRHFRREGDILHPSRESLEELNRQALREPIEGQVKIVLASYRDGALPRGTEPVRLLRSMDARSAAADRRPLACVGVSRRGPPC